MITTTAPIDLKTKQLLDAKAKFSSIAERSENEKFLAPGQRVYIENEDKYYRKMADGSWEEDGGGACSPIPDAELLEDINTIFGGTPNNMPNIGDFETVDEQEVVEIVSDLPISTFENDRLYATQTFVGEEINTALETIDAREYLTLNSQDFINALNAKQDKFNLEQQSALNSGVNANKITGYDTHVLNTNIHVSAAEKQLWNNTATNLSQNYYTKAEVDELLRQIRN